MPSPQFFSAGRRAHLFQILALAAASSGALPAHAATPALPDTLQRQIYPGAELSAVTTENDANGSARRLAGTLPGGQTEVRFPRGSQRFEFKIPGYVEKSADREARIVKIQAHYDEIVRKAGGQRLDQGDAPQSWLDINARLFLYRLPTPDGAVDFGLWIQDGGASHFLLLMPRDDVKAAPRADDLAGKLQAVGRAALYIEFDTNKAELKPEGRKAVDQVAALLKSDAALKLSIEGHTDDVGGAAQNKPLSLARAQAVLTALTAQGIDAKRLRAVGHGQDKPVADNKTEAGRARNRRVELVRLP
jgi:OmpA-OmpF porin, OOP family